MLPGTRRLERNAWKRALGWYFVANATIQVTSLGFYDDLKNGLTESHPVAIYDKDTQAMLGSTTVSPSDPLDGYFRYTSLAPPVALTPGRRTSYWRWSGTRSTSPSRPSIRTWTVNTAITYTGDAVN